MYLYAGKLPYLNLVEPYTVCILALHELDYGRNAGKVKAFIEWYFENLNYPDRYMISGTIYDYHIRRDRVYTEEKYDSIDGYSGIFLHLLLKYAKLTGDRQLISDHWEQIEDVALTIPLMQEGDGLTIALITTNQKYLADNCESYGGLSAYLELREMVGRYPQPSLARARDNIKKGIMARMYQKKKNIFAHTIENDEVMNASWDRYYPDAFAQFFLIYYDVIKGDKKLIKHIWSRFTQKHAAREASFPIEQWVMYQLAKNKMQREYADLL